jgi:hypothetical protein
VPGWAPSGAGWPVRSGRWLAVKHPVFAYAGEELGSGVSQLVGERDRVVAGIEDEQGNLVSIAKALDEAT